MKLIKQLFVAMAMLCAAQVHAEAELDKDYKLVSPAQPTHSGNKIEVMEFFFYGCSHCFHLHPALSAWDKKKPSDVEMVYVPTVFNPNWEPMANAHYALELMGQQKKLDDALYNAWAAEEMLIDADQIGDFVAKHGVDRQKFLDLYHSFSVQSKVARSKQMVLSYHITGTPTLIVDGKYAIINKVRAEDTIASLEAVIAMARKEHAGKH